MVKQKIVCAFMLVILEVCSATWSTTPGPYYQRFNDGSYNYGYNAGGGYSARQSATAANEVSGQYSQLLPDGNLVDVRYKAGVGGFRPQLGAGLTTTARPYGFAYNTGDAFHQAAADSRGNVRGNYWYRDPAGGRHDLRYSAGPGIGFVPTGGSLAVPNGLGRRSLASGIPAYSLTTPRWNGPTTSVFNDGPHNDGSYGFAYDDPNIADSAYRNNDGNHGLPSVAGQSTGFHPTGGSLASPNGLGSRSSIATPSSIQQGGPRSDGSYNFGYRTPDSSRQEGGDGRGNVHGSYAFRNRGGNHDLAFVAGPGIGFQPTGGTLSRPNGLGVGSGGLGAGDLGRRYGEGGGRYPALGNNAGHAGAGHVGGGNRDHTGGLGHVGHSEVTGGFGSSGGNNPSGRHGISQQNAAEARITGSGGHQGNIGGGIGSRSGVFDGGSGTGFGHDQPNTARSNAVGPSGVGEAGGSIGNQGKSTGGLGLGTGTGIGHGTGAGGGPAVAGTGGYLAGTPGGTSAGLGSTTGGEHLGPGHLGAAGDSSRFGEGRGHRAFASGLSGDAGLLGGYQNGGGAGGLPSSNFGGSGSRTSGLGGIGTHGNGGFGSGSGAYGQSGLGDSVNGGYSYGSGVSGSSGGDHGLNGGGGSSAALSVQSLQASGSGLHNAGSSGGSSGGAISGEQQDLQSKAELRSVEGSSSIKGVSQ